MNSFCVTEALYPWTNGTSLLPAPCIAPGNDLLTLCVYGFNFLDSVVMQYLSSCVCLLSLSILSSRFIHIVTNDSLLLFKD